MKYLRLSGLLGLLVVLLAVVTDCTSAPKALETESDFTGFITVIHPVGEKGVLGQILVESHSDKLVDKYMVKIKDETQIFQQSGVERCQVAFGALETGQRVQLWFTRPVMESFPMQATAQ